MCRLMSHFNFVIVSCLQNPKPYTRIEYMYTALVAVVVFSFLVPSKSNDSYN